MQQNFASENPLVHVSTIAAKKARGKILGVEEKKVVVVAENYAQTCVSVVSLTRVGLMGLCATGHFTYK